MSTLSLDIQNRVKQLSVELRQRYIDYIGTITQAQPEDWWRSSVSEKNPYVSNTFYYICCLKAYLEYLRSGGSESHLIIEEPALRSALNKNLEKAGSKVRISNPFFTRWLPKLRAHARIPLFQIYFLRHAVRIFHARYQHRLHRLPALKAMERTPLAVTHIWVDQRAYSPDTGEFRNADFADVADYLRARGRVVAELPEILFDGESYRKVVRYVAQSQKPFLVPHAFLRLRDVLASLWHSLTHIPKRRTYPIFQGMEISDLIFADLQREWFTQRQAENFLIERRVERMKQAGIVVERFIYTFENHTWERITCNALRTAYPSVKLIGYQPNGLPLMLLNYFISEPESQAIPLPDRIVANGSYTARIMADGGFGRQRVVLGGGLRQKYLQSLLYGGAAPPRRQRNRSCVLVAPSISRDRTVELILKTVRAFERASHFDVVLKCHPAIRFEQLKPFLGAVEIPQHIQISTEPLMNLLPAADVLVYNDGTFAAAEALAFGLPAVFVEADYGLSLDSLDGFPDSRSVVRTAEEIAQTVSGLLGSQQTDVNAPDVARQLAGEVTERTFEFFSS